MRGKCVYIHTPLKILSSNSMRSMHFQVYQSDEGYIIRVLTVLLLVAQYSVNEYFNFLHGFATDSINKFERWFVGER